MMLASRCPPSGSAFRGLSLIKARLSTSAPRCRRPRTPPPTSRLGHTTVFYQAGLKIRELPLVVQKVNDVLKISGMDTFGDLVISTGSTKARSSASVKLPPDEETKEVLAGFNRCFSVHGIFRLLETVPTEEVTPLVAVHVLKKIIDLENDNFSRSTVPPTPKTPLTVQLLQDRGQTPSKPPPPPPPQPKPAVVLTQTGVSKNDNFLRIAFINMLLDIVYRSKDPSVILDGLRVISRDSFPVDQDAYKERMCEETLLCVSNGLFDLTQICEAVVVLSDFFADKKKCQKICDKLWSGILDASDQIDASTISSVFKTLPHLKNSRDIVFKFVSDRVEQHWQEYTIRDVLEILKSLMDVSLSNGRTGGATASHSKVLKVVSQWLKVNIHTLNEGETLAVIYCLHRLEYLDEVVVQTLERYLKVRGCQIRERDLVATICDYCMDFRVRSKAILEGAGEYFIAHADQLSTPQLYSIVRVFGELDFHPPNGFKFWELVETVLERRFHELPPREAIDLLLSFVYIERYPLNFVRRLFNPHFLDRLHEQDTADVAYSRTQLGLFDAVMCMEARNYGGPFLPKDTGSKNIPLPSMQVARLANSLVRPLGEVVGDPSRVSTRVALASLPRHSLYVADLMIYPSVAASVLRLGMKTDNSQTVAVLLHPSEHRTSDGYLVGPQAMRKRQLKAMGFKVLELDCEELSRLRVNPNKLRMRLVEKYQEALASQGKK